MEIKSEIDDLVHSMKFYSDDSQLVYGMELAPGDHEGFKQYIVMNGKK